MFVLASPMHIYLGTLVVCFFCFFLPILLDSAWVNLTLYITF